MDEVIGLGVVVLGVSLGIFYLGSKYGAAVEQEIVAKALAEYKTTRDSSAVVVAELLSKLHNDYTRAYIDVINRFKKVI
jgi:hypothetical protein